MESENDDFEVLDYDDIEAASQGESDFFASGTDQDDSNRNETSKIETEPSDNDKTAPTEPTSTTEAADDKITSGSIRTAGSDFSADERPRSTEPKSKIKLIYNQAC